MASWGREVPITPGLQCPRPLAPFLRTGPQQCHPVTPDEDPSDSPKADCCHSKHRALTSVMHPGGRLFQSVEMTPDATAEFGNGRKGGRETGTGGAVLSSTAPGVSPAPGGHASHMSPEDRALGKGLGAGGSLCHSGRPSALRRLLRWPQPGGAGESGTAPWGGGGAEPGEKPGVQRPPTSGTVCRPLRRPPLSVSSGPSANTERGLRGHACTQCSRSFHPTQGRGQRADGWRGRNQV